MTLEILKSKWNLLLEISAALVVLLSGFIDIPNYAAAALASEANYELLARVVVAGVIGLMMIPCGILNKRIHIRLWGILAAVLLIISLVTYFKYVSFKKNKTVDYTSYSGTYVVKGDHLLPEMDSLRNEIEKVKKGKISDTDFFAENHNENDSTGTLTAAALWPPVEIEKNARNIILFYLLTMVLFTLFVICLMQSIYCISKEKVGPSS